MFGIIIFFLGVVAYAYLSFQKKQQKAPPPSLETGLKAKLNESTKLISGESVGQVCCVIS